MSCFKLKTPFYFIIKIFLSIVIFSFYIDSQEIKNFVIDSKRIKPENFLEFSEFNLIFNYSNENLFIFYRFFSINKYFYNAEIALFRYLC